MIRKLVVVLLTGVMCLIGVTSVLAMTYSEAPMLRTMVAAGELPPVEERLPEKPLVVGPGTLVNEKDLDWEVGQYGGVLRSVTPDKNLDWNLRDACIEYFLFTPSSYLSPLSGGIAEDFSVSEDNMVFTLHLRKGLKWSDGIPVTTEDVRFTYQDVLLNKELTPIMPANFRAGGDPEGEPMKLEIIDTYTFKIIFNKPYARFLVHLGMENLWNGVYQSMLMPSHYLKQFHSKYTPVEKLQPHLKKYGMSKEEWWRLFQTKEIMAWEFPCNREAVGYPTLGPWFVTEYSLDRVVMERNPYYWKVDIEGNQLPYVDRYETSVVADPRNIPMKIIAGEVNLLRDLVEHEKVPLYREQEKKGGYRVDLNLVYHNAPIALFINYNYSDPTWYQVVNDYHFRQAVNMAINRQEIIDILFLGMGITSPWFPSEYNPQKAEQLLDEMGMDKRDAQGDRLAPNGESFEFFIEYYEGGPYWGRIVELLIRNLREVGIKSTMKRIGVSLWTEKVNASQLQASVDWLDDVRWPYPNQDYMPNQRIQWGRKWHQWYLTGGEEGLESPEWIKELYEIDNQFNNVQFGTERYKEVEKVFVEWMWKNIPMFPVARDVVSPVIVPPNLGNLAHSGFASATWFSAEQFFLKK